MKYKFFNRIGGVSEGFFSSLNTNFKSSDNPENLLKNIDIVGKSFGLGKENLVVLKQSITSTAVYVNEPSLHTIQADGVVTDKKNLILSISTADCAPVLLEDRINGIIGAAHAGWRGALKGVVENTIDLMIKKGAKVENIKAAIGPCLQKNSFECRSDMYSEFIEKDPAYKAFFTNKNDGQWLFDAENFVKSRIASCGIKNIIASGIDTYKEEDLYFSYRRSTHRKQTQYFAAHISAITL